MIDKYYNTKESVDEYIKLALDVSGRELIEKLKSLLPVGAKVLELGSGPGTDWRILSEIYDTTGSDNSTEFLNHLIAENPKGDFLELDANTIRTENKYDGIYSNKVLHHLSDAELRDSISAQFKVLNPGGIICHSFWKGEGDEVFKGLFVNYYEKPNLEESFKDYFDIISIQAYREFDQDDSLLLIGKKK